MKICFLTDTFCDTNGVSRFLQDISSIAHRQNHQIYLITSTKKQNCTFLPNTINIQPKLAFPIPYYKELDIVIPPFKGIKKYLDTIKPDIIHISTPGIIGYYGVQYATKNNIILAGTYHTDFPQYVLKNTKINLLHTLTTKYMKHFYKDFDLLFTRSKSYISLLKENIVSQDTTLVTLQSGTDTKKFSPSFKDNHFKSQFLIPNNHTLFLYVGRITDEKNIDFLLKIFYENFKDAPATLLLAGSGKIDFFKKRYTHKNIRFLGNIYGDQLSKLYASCDYFIFPSITDTLGQVVLEALSSGTPAIVTDIGGPKDIINNAKNQIGFTLNSKDASQWIDLINTILDKKIDKKLLSHNARDYALRNSIETSFEDFVSHHLNLL